MPVKKTPFRKGFETQQETVTVDSLPVQGTIPDWLKGTYVRNGPGQFDLEHGRYWHWFDGLAMPHRYKFEDGKVSFANRYIQSEAYKKDNATQKLNFRMSATDPMRTVKQKLFSMFHMDFTDNTNVHTLQMADEYVSLTEREVAWTFDLDTLETKGLFKYDNSIGNATQTAHQHYDPVSKTQFNLALRSGMKSAYEIYSFKGRKYTLLGRVPTWTPSYMHSFGMTENYIILAEYPMQMTLGSILQFLFSDTPYLANFAWRPQQETTLTVISKNTGKVVKQVQAEAFFAFHHINAFERGNEVVMDVAAYADSSIVQGLYVQTMISDVEYSTMTAEYRRYTIQIDNPSSLTSVNYDLTSDDRIILPRINYNHYNAKPYKYAYGVNTSGDRRDFINQLVRVNTALAEVDKRWHVDGHYPSEAVFAPRPGATEEDDGVIMSTIYNSETEKSYLLLLDGQTFDVRATADIPIRIPFGFHGRWYPNGNMYAL